MTRSMGVFVSDSAQPGVLPMRPLTTGELLDAAVVLLRTRASKLIGFGVAAALVEQALLFPLRRLADQDSSLLPATGRLTEFGFLVVAGFACEAFLIAVLGGVAAREGPRALLGAAAPPRPSQRPFALVLVALVAATVSAIGAIPFLLVLIPLQSLGIAMAIFLTAVLWPLPYGVVGLAAPAVVVDRASAGGALLRSLFLTSRNGLRAAWIRILGYLAWLVIRFGLTAATMALVTVAFSSDSSTMDNLLLGGVALIVNGLAYPMLGCLDAVLHLETRMRTEGLDIGLRSAVRRGVAADTALTVPRVGVAHQAVPTQTVPPQTVPPQTVTT
jgi:hypothetical protein